MTDDLDSFRPNLAPTPEAPLLGLTVLVVEDSRFACEALRLLCLRSGARIRRADCLRAAGRHLATYRPAVAIIDLGLPDGSGLDLIARLNAMVPRLPAIVATSGDPALDDAARRAGADGFLAKPLEDLAQFQRAIMAALPARARIAVASRAAAPLVPDRLALGEDLARAEVALSRGQGLDYVGRFLAGLGRSAHDSDLEDAARELVGIPPAQAAQQLARLRGLVGDRRRRIAGC